ncbi:MAG: SPOR domain-containing protein [Betaproteobacteria bacterium]|nr:MAG: SPOR domain-containing protein [Betaproteobacteria bacterium]
MAEAQDVNLLRRRGRRRLVGAIALVLLAAIVLPMVFDPEPNSSAPPISVRIPGEDAAGFSPKAAPKAAPPPAPQAAAPSAPAVTAPAAPKPEPATPKAEEKPVLAAPAAAPVAVEKPVPATASSEQFVVPVAALASQAKVKDLVGKLKAARLPYYTEPLATATGTVTRIRAGPFATRDAAEQAQRQLQRLGLKPGNVLAKS